MADWIIKDTTLKKIADKVRGLNDSSASMLVKNIAENIPEKQDKNVAITENGTKVVKPDNGKILGDVTIETNVAGGNKPEQAKTISITANGTQTVMPDTGKVLSQVIVVTNVEGGEVILQEKTVSPSLEQQQVRPDSGYGGLSQVTVEAVQTEEKTVTPTDSDLSVIPTTGKLLSKVKVNAVPTEEKTATENGEVLPSEGKFLSKVTVNVPKPETQVKTVEVTENNKTTYVFPDSGKTISQVVINTRVPGVDFTKVTAEAANVAPGKTFYNKNGSLTYGTMLQYNGEYFTGLYPPTISVASDTLMWEEIEGADKYIIYKQISASEWDVLAETTSANYSLISLPVGYYSLCVTAVGGDLETPKSNIVQWVKASISYTLTNTSIKSASAYVTTDTPATITLERAFGYVLPYSVEVTFAQQDSYSNGVLVISSPTSANVTITANGAKDKSESIPAGTYKFKDNPTAIQSNLTEDINFTANGASYTALSAYSNGNINYINGNTVVPAYNGTTWSDSRTITVTSTARVSADFLSWFNKAMEDKLGAPVLAINGAILSWGAITNATSYEIRYGATNPTTKLATTSGTSFDISTYGKTMGAGSHNIAVIAKATGFADSSISNIVGYTVYRLAEPINFGCYASNGYEIFTWEYPPKNDLPNSGTNATGADIYEQGENGEYTKVASDTYVEGATPAVSIQPPYANGTHTYVCKCTDSTGVYADSNASYGVSFSVFPITWNTVGVVKPSENYALSNEDVTIVISPSDGYSLPDTIQVQGLSDYTWTKRDDGKATFSYLKENINATSFTVGIVVTITAIENKKATIAAGTYQWVTDPEVSSTYIEVNFSFTSGGTSYNKISSGNGDYIKYDDTQVYSKTNGATWNPSSAKTIVVSSAQEVPQAAYDFFFGGSLLKQLSKPSIIALGKYMCWDKVENATQYSFSVTQSSNTYDFGTIYDIHNFVEAKSANYNFNNKTITFTKGDYDYNNSVFAGSTVRIMFTNGCYFEIMCGAGIVLKYYESYAGSEDTISNSAFDTPISFSFRDGSSDTGEPYVDKFLIAQSGSSTYTEITPEEFKAGITLNFNL